MQIWAIRKGFEAFKCNSNHLKVLKSVQTQILTFRKEFKAFESKFEPFKQDSKHLNANCIHSKGIQRNRVQIPTIQKGFEAFEFKFYPFEKEFEAFKSKFESFEKEFECESEPLKEIRT